VSVELNDELSEFIDELKSFTLVATEELNVEYPVVPVNITWELPDMTPSLFNLDLIVVLMDEVKVFKLPVLVSIADNLLIADAVNVFKLPSALSKLPILVLTEELKSVRFIPSIVPVISIEPDTTISFAKTTGVPPTDD
jgi:hypothetical protein